MKTSIILFALSMFAVTIAHADDSAYANILKERDAVLSELLAKQEKRYANGMTTEETVDTARLALWTFRRDTAKSNAEKIKQQEVIVGVYEKRLSIIKNRSKQGLAADEEVLLATDSLLQAKQTLEELKERG